MNVAALARALPSLRGVGGVHPFRPEVLSQVVCAELVTAQQAMAKDRTPNKDHEANRAAAAQRFAAASVVLMSLPPSSHGVDGLSMYMDLCDVWTLLREDDRAVIATWLASSENFPAVDPTEAIDELAERITEEIEEEQAANRPHPSMLS